MIEFKHTTGDPLVIKRLADAINNDTDSELAAIRLLGSSMGHLLDKLSLIESKLYQPGGDDIGGRFHKDIKDTDDVLSDNADLNVPLYNEVLQLLDEVDRLDDKFGDDKVSGILYDETGDYKLKPIYTDEALKRIKRKATSMIEYLS